MTTLNCYENWYVLNVYKGKEEQIKSSLEKLSEDYVKMFVFKKEVFHEKKGRSFKVTKPLFPGYIFIHEKLNEIITIKRKYMTSEYIEPICFDGKPKPLFKEEIELLLKNSDTNGLIQSSVGKKEKDRIVVLDGALKNINSKILWIDEKKKKVKVELKLFNRVMLVSLSLEMLQ